MESPSVFEEALADLLGIEGGFSDIEADRGGKTNWGITERVARGSPYFYQGDMRDLPFDLAARIYREQYWDERHLQLTAMAESSGAVAKEIFDQAVNIGVYQTAKYVQRVLNILNREEILYADLKVDGWLGVGSRAAVDTLIGADDEHYLLQWLNVAQGRHYFDLCESDPKQEAFARGWVDKRVQV